MEVSKCRLCFRHSWVQKFKCDCDSAFVCLSVCFSLHLGLSLPLYGALFPGRISMVTKVESATPCLITTISTALVERKPLISKISRKKSWIESQRTNLCQVTSPDDDNDQGIRIH